MRLIDSPDLDRSKTPRYELFEIRSKIREEISARSFLILVAEEG